MTDAGKDQDLRIVQRAIRDVLSDIYTSEGVESVMRSRNTMLDGRSPNDLLEAREFERIHEWLSRLGDGNCS